MFRAKPRNGASKRGGVGVRLATRFGVAHRSSFRSKTRADARLVLPWLGIPHFAPEPEAESRLVLALLASSRSAPESSALRGLA
jgi:hypothetical protein